MKIISFLIISILIVLFFIFTFETQEFNPDINHIIKNACPFEGCRYGEWKVTNRTTLYKEKNTKSKKISIVNTGETVNALTGDVHLKPVKLIVTKNHTVHKKNETIWLLNYLGEGNYKAWKNNKFININLPFSPYQEMNCSQYSDCWASLEDKYSFIWWVKLKTQTGIIGWSNQAENFKNKNSCC